jgi:hypothetical protein
MPRRTFSPPSSPRTRKPGDALNRDQSNTLDGNGKVGIYAHVLSEFEKRLRVLEMSVSLLIARTRTGDFWADGFQDVAKLLETVPLTTSEFRSAKRHLQNAYAYSCERECGAAAFELRIIRGMLQRL